MKLLVHDLKDGLLPDFIEKSGEYKILPARRIAPCAGCFGCWLKTPGRCVMHDGFENMGELFAACSELILVSRNVYGGFSTDVKNVLDRSISFSLPFFTRRNREMHHSVRYKNRFSLKAVFYPAADITNEEKDVAREIVRANGVNFNAADSETVFIGDLSELREVLG